MTCVCGDAHKPLIRDKVVWISSGEGPSGFLQMEEWRTWDSGSRVRAHVFWLWIFSRVTHSLKALCTLPQGATSMIPLPFCVFPQLFSTVLYFHTTMYSKSVMKESREGMHLPSPVIELEKSRMDIQTPSNASILQCFSPWQAC